ncbi:hypothetical protein CcaverHIS002_0600790 [Cutaneotrichosporon cavernicola]|uniref:Uncharacterized protein n=1 Tax=Cutaneotrichosporon cavernicola TaxID=279322 RepID=A0AA48QWK0_9TREE|nr:uncharacterized protein CcaverHIS019_0500880 [Cutaneotrichosporon cavernicola]BEI85792.1 hypothetical protein CcaverHIS002_0600790 [Cutaneotrichosporon cavernicola]BEI92460.1 hypothetical protein CcaverHIS019_0500880 [Cutaneotrichosporon cavernicola]BEJ00232.1 hypothetical protein CcaverHIS631_0500890 [Cutaneotrichosporon cavernicola]BEJ08003.1 hypothetical protein CcaverHIS641_0500880 [Cutaneotrichosporon cavernicola]
MEPAPASYFAKELAVALATAPEPHSEEEAALWSHIVLGARLEERLVTEIRTPTAPHTLLPYPGGSAPFDAANLSNQEEEDDLERIKILGRVGPSIKAIDLVADVPDTHLLLTLEPRVVRRSLPIFFPWTPDVLVDFADLHTLEPLFGALMALDPPMARRCSQHIVHVSDLLPLEGNKNDYGLQVLGLLCATRAQNLDLVLHGDPVRPEQESKWADAFVGFMVRLAELLDEMDISVIGLELLFPGPGPEGNHSALTDQDLKNHIAEVKRKASEIGVDVPRDGFARLHFLTVDEWLDKRGIDDEMAQLCFVRPQYDQPLAEVLYLQSLYQMAGVSPYETVPE